MMFIFICWLIVADDVQLECNWDKTGYITNNMVFIWGPWSSHQHSSGIPCGMIVGICTNSNGNGLMTDPTWFILS